MCGCWAWACKTATEAWVAFFIFFVSFDAVTVEQDKNGFQSRMKLQNGFQSKNKLKNGFKRRKKVFFIVRCAFLFLKRYFKTSNFFNFCNLFSKVAIHHGSKYLHPFIECGLVFKNDFFEESTHLFSCTVRSRRLDTN